MRKRSGDPLFSEQLSQENIKIASHPYELPPLCGSDEAGMPLPVLSWNSAFTSSPRAYSQVCITTFSYQLLTLETRKKLAVQAEFEGVKISVLISDDGKV